MPLSSSPSTEMACDNHRHHHTPSPANLTARTDALCRSLTDTLHRLAAEAERVSQPQHHDQDNPSNNDNDNNAALEAALVRVEGRVQSLSQIVRDEQEALRQVEVQRLAAVQLNEALGRAVQQQQRQRQQQQQQQPAQTQTQPLRNTMDQREHEEMENTGRDGNIDTRSSGRVSIEDLSSDFASLPVPSAPTPDTPIYQSDDSAMRTQSRPPRARSASEDLLPVSSKPKDTPAPNAPHQNMLHHSLSSHTPHRTTLTDAKTVSVLRRRTDLEHVTLEELTALPHHSRGRLSLVDLNAALDDIARVCEVKSQQQRNNNSSRRRRRMPTPQPAFCLHGSSKENRAGSNHRSSSSSSLSDPWVVGEQELRQSCSFFRTGESTARSILAVLRTLGRLKQVPSKSGDVTYVVGR